MTLDEFLAKCERFGSAGPLTVNKLVALCRELQEQRGYYEWLTKSSLTLSEIGAEKNENKILKIINGSGGE